MTESQQAMLVIDDALKYCAACPQRVELMREHGAIFSKIDGYCNRECPVGGLLQLQGKNLVRDRT
ncbi:zinc-finger domain-containing protein [Paenibacillus sp. HN-1]|uniref:zinc-finger domain-containing protein n=1 Tax=Paenibacillus TaxID=44249 RepID=UPI001CA90524|nr:MULTISPECIES: zinc-finger domain-containing protein [Paenibacillus]MBY9081031.1 zinc-finger domain-containing protein [Paenibacillus sp. CGMCC 1.18879]MBY9087068.1 zinc-finger domain-containing protein [Paenibacillus sinensis]